ncbi:MAG: hypothetical protein LUE24_08440 [Lachnospiraceae bacterium]|nr:hypothetical protein [Lachnospiraceae bacterium]
MTNILIVEDDRAISHLIAGTLTREGFRCICAMDGEEGLTRFDEGSFVFTVYKGRERRRS